MIDGQGEPDRAGPHVGVIIMGEATKNNIQKAMAVKPCLATSKA